MKLGKISLVALVLLSVTFFGGQTAEATLGKVDYWNWSFSENDGQIVDITEKDPSGEYLSGPTRKLRIYGWGPTVGNPTNHKINPIGINSDKAYVLELRLEADSTMPNDKDNAIDICWMGPVNGDSSYTPFERNGRNFVMRQHPDSPSSYTDPNVYDLIDLTDGFTQNAQISLPDITSSTPRIPQIYDKWQKIVANYADLEPSVVDGNSPDGKVNWKDLGHMSLYWLRNDCNESNHWCDYSDLDRDGKVDFNDFAGVGQQWRVDANSIR